MTIAVVENDILARASIVALINQLGFTIAWEAGSVSAAETELAKVQPDLAIVDIELDGSKTGLDLAGTLNKIGTPFIISSSFQDPVTYAKVQEVAPAGYFEKPWTLNNLRNAIGIAMAAKAPQYDKLLTVKVGGKLQRIEAENIVYLKASGNDCEVFLKMNGNQSRKVFAAHPLGTLLSDQLRDIGLIRVSRSYAVARKSINNLHGRQLTLEDGTVLSVGEKYKPILLAQMTLL